MDFLTICQDVANDIGLQGTLSNVDPQQPLHIDVVNSVKRAWLSIQKVRGLSKFMMRRTDFTTTDGTTAYDISTIVVPTTSTQVGHIVDIYYEKKRLAKLTPWLVSLNTATDEGGAPVWWREDQDFGHTNLDTTITFNTMDRAYELEVLYRNQPQILSASTDVPMFPEEHHKLIYHKAMMSMAAQQERVGLHGEHKVEYDMQMGYLLRTTNPKKTLRYGKRFV